jgi:hypothetical protein
MEKAVVLEHLASRHSADLLFWLHVPVSSCPRPRGEDRAHRGRGRGLVEQHCGQEVQVRWRIGRLDAEHVGTFANGGNVGFLCLAVLGKLTRMCGATARAGIDLRKWLADALGAWFTDLDRSQPDARRYLVEVETDSSADVAVHR